MRRLTSVVWLSLTLGFSVLAALSAVAPTSAQEADEGARPGLWSGSTAVSGFHLHLNTDPTVLPIAEFINVDVPYGNGTWSSGGEAEALASAFWPGTAVTEGPGLLCDFAGGCQQSPPPYPLSAKASTTDPEASTQDGSARAEVVDGHVSTSAGLSTGLEPVLSNLEQLFQADAIEATTDMRFEAGALVTRARTVLQGVSLLDGTITIESVETVTETRNDGAQTKQASAQTTVQGVSVAGQPATIGEDGVTIAGEGGGGEGIDQAEAQLASALEQFGADLRLIHTRETVEDAVATADAGGLILTFAAELAGPGLPTVPVPGAPIGVDPNVVYRTYVGSVTLGAARTTSFASTGGFGFGDEDLGDLSDLAPPANTDTGSSADEFDPPASRTVPAPEPPPAPAFGETPTEPAPTVAAPQAEAAPSQPAPDPAATPTVGFPAAVSQGLTAAYGAAALASAGLFLSSQLHRLPRPRAAA